MPSLNRVEIIGHVGRDPEMRSTAGGTAVCNFSVATSEKWKDKQTGEKQERTEWHNIVAWGRLAEICTEYAAKGKLVYVDGKLQTRSWEDKEGVKRYTTEIVASNVLLLGGRETANATAQKELHKDDDDIPF